MFQLKSVSEMRNEELMSFKLKWSFHIIRIKLKYDSHSYFSGQKKSRLSHRPDSQDHLDRFKLLDVKHESNQPGCDRTDRVINISKWGETHVIWDLMRWAVRTVYHARRELEVQGVMCYVLPVPVCLLSIPQPPLFDLSRCAAPAPAHRDGHLVTPCHTWDTGHGARGHTGDFSSHKNTNSNEWFTSCRVLSWRGVESVTDNLWCGHCTGHSGVTQTRQVWSVNLLSGSKN